ncbi:glucose-1-phosphate thymidylyltransferase RfbA [Candidatus Woesearchaeota archaeon]|nr:glucose-1-phosphate thymidylyltransferase RfbA [Candidatus Woesearchaeota archaeon]
MKGIVLAGGSGTRLYPMTSTHSKQLQPVYDKPMIYYPMATLMQAGIQDILLISTPEDIGNFVRIFEDGSRLGLNISYKVQKKPEGIAQAYTLGKDFLDTNDSMMILGDNIFHGDHSIIRHAAEDNGGATIFGYKVRDPQRYGVVEFDEHGKVLSLEEKPSKPKSNHAIPGLYVMDGEAPCRAVHLEPSKRGEYEIVDLIKTYFEEDQLTAAPLGRGFVWLDAGTPSSLNDASSFIRTIEERAGIKIACLEEIALREGFFDGDSYVRMVEELPDSPYRDYCFSVLE